MKTAILVDGGFYRRRSQSCIGYKSAALRANELYDYCIKHLSDKRHKNSIDLYRILYYDCPPMAKKVYHPLLKRTVDFGKTELYSWMTEFLNELKNKRKVALRMGQLAESQAFYNLRPEIIKKLCNGTINFSDLTEDNFTISVDQKGVDMKIGIDITSLAYKKQVDQIILISGDSDFVPAAKLARREGIDFILDPLGAPIKPDLTEHIDGLRTKNTAFK